MPAAQRMNLSLPVSLPADDDASLVARYVAGDDQAFAPLLDRYQSRVFTTLCLLVQDRGLAEELIQDTFVRAIKRLRRGNFDYTGNFGAWVCQLAHYVARDAMRKRRRRARLSVVGLGNPTNLLNPISRLVDPEALSPEGLIIQQESNDQLHRLIQGLPIAQREVLLLHHFGGMTFQQIADSTGSSISTTVARMRYALDKLRRVMLPAATSGTSLMVALLLAAGLPANTRLTRNDFFTYSSPSPEPDDPNLYSGNADPVRLQRPA